MPQVIELEVNAISDGGAADPLGLLKVYRLCDHLAYAPQLLDVDLIDQLTKISYKLYVD